jgi:hypothetical protein
MKKEDIKSLNDMAEYFFRVAIEIGHPLKNIDLTLTESWGEQKNRYQSRLDFPELEVSKR